MIVAFVDRYIIYIIIIIIMVVQVLGLQYFQAKHLKKQVPLFFPKINGDLLFVGDKRVP